MRARGKLRIQSLIGKNWGGKIVVGKKVVTGPTVVGKSLIGKKMWLEKVEVEKIHHGTHGGRKKFDREKIMSEKLW